MPSNGKGHPQKIGWIGAGRMGIPMAEKLIKAGYDVSVWNRTRAKAEPLAKVGGKVVDHLSDLKNVDILFSIVSTGKDVQEVLYGKTGVCSQGGKAPPIVVDCSTISVEDSAADTREAQATRRRVRRRADERQREGDQSGQGLGGRIGQRGSLQSGDADH